jgi:hypothetical protein
MKGLVFLSLVILLAIFLSVVATKKTTANPVKESFQPLVIPEPGPPAQPILAGEKAKPYSPPSATLLTAPFGETSDVTSRPFQDPALDKAPYNRLYELLQDLNAFHDFELQKLLDTSDPAISLPLSTFRGDRQRLQDEVSFLNRNPGLQSTLTIGDVQGIRVNLTYLQKKARQLQGGLIDASTEGFADAGQVAAKATQAELEDANFRITTEIARLQASGTTDPVFQQRVTLLQKIQQSITTLVNQLKAKTLLPEDVPITSQDLKDFLPALSDTSKPIGNFLNSISAPAGTSNLFPSYEGGDISGAQLANALFEKYGETFFKGLSWNVNVNYTSPNDVEVNRQKALQIQGLEKTDSPLNQQFQLGTMASDPRGAFDQAIRQISNSSSSGSTNSNNNTYSPNINPGTGRPSLPEPNASKFNWQERAAQICESIRSQGLDPSDFGCLKNHSKVGSDFSWRGYSKMVCTRLQTTMDSGLPEVCGCPPVGWAGWRQ